MSPPGDPLQRIAVLSDVHGNLVALRAVLDDVAARGIDQIAVAGDLVGFGPNANEVVDLLVARGAALIRGNHEQDYVAPYAIADVRDHWRRDPRLASLCWYVERLGPDRRAFLAALPDRLWLDDATLVIHGSPRHIRDAVLATTPDDEVEAMFAQEPACLAFVGHTHRATIRTTARRRVVNVGSVGLPLDGDPRAAYVVATRPAGVPSGAWSVTPLRVAYDVEAAVAAYGNGLGAADPGFAALMARELRTARSYLSSWMRASARLAADELPAALRHYLTMNP